MHSHLYVQWLERAVEDSNGAGRGQPKTPPFGFEVSDDIKTAVIAIITAAKNKDWSLFEDAVVEASELMPGVAERLGDL